MDAKVKNYTGWQSDVIVDMIKRYGFPYITLNPGASFRGLHDSLVNYGDNQPPMMLCNHEEIAVQIAHGYARSEEHTSELQSRLHLVCRLLLEKKKKAERAGFVRHLRWL